MALYLGLGSNLGERRRQLQVAVEMLSVQLAVTAVSPLYATPPWGQTDQPPFLNLCLVAETALPPPALLDLVKAVESALGRRPTYVWGPRLIDIDLLIYDNHVLATPELQLPHPYIAERAFVLAPLHDIAPALRHPVSGRSVAEMLAAVDVRGVTRLPEPLFGPAAAESER